MQPVVKLVLAKATAKESTLRREANRFAAAISEGIEQGLQIGGFAQLIKDTVGGYQGLAAAWRRRQRGQARSAAAQHGHREGLEQFLDNDPEAAAEGHEGDVLAVVCISDGVVKLRRVLEPDPDKVATIVARYMNKAYDNHPS